MKMNKIVPLVLALSTACAATGSAVRPAEGLEQRLREQYGCVGVGVSPVKGTALRRDDAGFRAKMDYRKRCLGKSPGDVGYLTEVPLNVEFEYTPDGLKGVAYALPPAERPF